MKTFTLITFFSLFGAAVLAGAERERIRVAAGPDNVVTIPQRESALAIGKRLLDNSPAPLDTLLADLHTPFQFRRPVVAEVEEPEEEEKPDATLPRDDFEVLRILAPRLQRDVQGSLIMGQRRRLIWAGGQTLEVGHSFRTRISETDPNLYEITISEIRQNSFSIRLNQAEITIPIGDTSGSGVVRGGGG